VKFPPSNGSDRTREKRDQKLPKKSATTMTRLAARSVAALEEAVDPSTTTMAATLSRIAASAREMTRTHFIHR